MHIEPKIIDFFISTTENSSNKDVCYYSSYNLPAFIYVLGPDSWERIKPLYLKCFKFNEAKIQKTLGHSIHEFARILGPQITQEDLVPIIRKFLSDQNQFKEARMGALKSLHIFLE
jgi:serine/threonine-protein phosphatase 4 regulatory subunit 1